MNEMSLAQIAAACCGTYIGAEAEKTVLVLPRVDGDRDMAVQMKGSERGGKAVCGLLKSAQFLRRSLIEFGKYTKHTISSRMPLSDPAGQKKAKTVLRDALRRRPVSLLRMGSAGAFRPPRYF